MNKISILERLVSKNMPNELGHVKKMKDLRDARVEFKSESSKETSKEEDYIVCPSTKMEFNGSGKFVGLWSCGCVFA